MSLNMLILLESHQSQLSHSQKGKFLSVVFRSINDTVAKFICPAEIDEEIYTHAEHRKTI
ncbi:hypothetical protein KDI_10930 [Dictyobacter arantiisoli]|uniref:Uncharacterized protein n=1 Tax=Dictyobacter arantiisoli TaxID=2014874 RepID=A0A5A5T957_9CHLR|nr:hypothetical protein KDI_10930 [Dictyobacter arantiisoli]